jgi:hypothetical protein
MCASVLHRADLISVNIASSPLRPISQSSGGVRHRLGTQSRSDSEAHAVLRLGVYQASRRHAFFDSSDDCRLVVPSVLTVFSWAIDYDSIGNIVKLVIENEDM